MKILRDGDTFIAPKGSYFEGNVKINGDFMVPPGTHFWGNLDVDGDLELGPGSSVGARVICANAVIGPKTVIEGPLSASGNVTVCDSAAIGSISAGGDVILRPGVVTGDVQSEGTVYVYGRIKTGRLFGRQVKVLRNSGPAQEDLPGQPQTDQPSS